MLITAIYTKLFTGSIDCQTAVSATAHLHKLFNTLPIENELRQMLMESIPEGKSPSQLGVFMFEDKDLKEYTFYFTPVCESFCPHLLERIGAEPCEKPIAKEYPIVVRSLDVQSIL